MNMSMIDAAVTGASTGIGRAVAVALGGAGATVHLLGRNEASLKETATLVEDAGGRAQVHLLDLSDPASCRSVADSVVSAATQLRLVANVAGVWHDDNDSYQGPLLHDTPAAQITEVLRVGVEGTMLLTAGLLGPLVEAKSGHILNISGTFSDGAKGWLHYFVSKQAIEAFTVGLAQEMRDFEVQVNCISPADVATPAYQRFYPEYADAALQPEEVAEFAMNLFSDGCRHVSGQIIVLRNRADHE